MTIDSLMAKTNHHVARLSSQSSKTHNDNDQDEDSWGVKAFADDTSSRMGTTWPPRSYTCSFCKRKFRSPQALGGHMNVHRRDRACLHQITKKTLMKNSNPNASTFNSSSTSTSRGSTLLIPITQDFLVNGGLCLLYQFRNENNHNPYNPDKNPSSAFKAAFPNASYPSSITSNDHQSSRKHILSASLDRYYPKNSIISKGGHNSHYNSEELDLELQLGHGPTTSS